MAPSPQVGPSLITVFKGGTSSGRKSCVLAVQDALVEALLKAKELGYSHILILSNKYLSVLLRKKLGAHT